MGGRISLPPLANKRERPGAFSASYSISDQNSFAGTFAGKLSLYDTSPLRGSPSASLNVIS